MLQPNAFLAPALYRLGFEGTLRVARSAIVLARPELRALDWASKKKDLLAVCQPDAHIHFQRMFSLVLQKRWKEKVDTSSDPRGITQIPSHGYPIGQ